MRWLFHVLRADEVGWGTDGRYRPWSLQRDGFIHASYREAVLDSARLYFSEPARDLRVLAIDPRRLDVPVEIVATPRGPMPHIRGAIPCDAVRVLGLDAILSHPDEATGTRIGFCAFEGMTLLDLVGPLDAISRIASMGFDASTSCEVIALTRPPEDSTVSDVVVWRAWGAAFVAARYRPALDLYDVLVLPGGTGVQDLLADETIRPYLESFPRNRLIASVCTGALLLGATGRLEGKRATTHAIALGQLASYGATAVKERVVDEGNVITAAGVTAGIDLGLYIVGRLAGAAVADAIADRMEVISSASARLPLPRRT
jgi:cyclohexyl-isocyanide hydratase